MFATFRVAPRTCSLAKHRTSGLRHAYSSRSYTISDPTRGSSPQTILGAHPQDPGSSSSTGGSLNSHGSSSPSPQASTSSATYPPPPEGEEREALNTTPLVAVTPPPEHSGDPPEPPTNLPSPQAPKISSYNHPPFDTHRFFAALEKTFPTPTARSLMRATRALLVDRIGRVRREALTVKDLESQAYLFKAALSELRTELTMRTRNESAAMRTASAALRREVDVIEGRMNEDIGTMKHEIQMELDSRKNEAKNDVKQMDIEIEEMHNKSLVTLGELRTMMEEVRWDNMRKSVAALSGFLILIVFGMEVTATRQPKPKPKPPPPEPLQDGESLQYT
ncbi:hypothetical protein BDW22DRAFT_1341747 [Trametopsis cervina]|nr:hypothetical protein BDW22DRAFT_1341747 [Trametopsis cervina]